VLECVHGHLSRSGRRRVRSAPLALLAGLSLLGGTAALAPIAEASVVIPAAAIVHTTAILVAPLARAGDRDPKVTVGLKTQNGSSALITLQRERGSAATYAVATTTHSQGTAAQTDNRTRAVRAGDRIEVRLAVSELVPARGATIGSVIAIRARDLRTGTALVTSGVSTLLAGGPDLPSGAEGEDIAVTAATWNRTWAGTGANLANESTDGTLTGVSQWGRDFFVTDGAHPRRGVPVGTVRLRASRGDRIVVTATTSVTGSHTDVAIVDRRNGHRVGAGC
jgi:hypothetical protein